MFSVLLFSTALSQTNIYFPLPTANAIWREHSGGYQCDCCSDYQYYIVGDTIIGNHQYKKITESGVRYYMDMNGLCTYNVQGYFNNQFVGAYRNDSINRKVYGVIYPWYMNDTLLYDFNLNLMDTIPTSLLYKPNGYISYVSDIDSILIGNTYHKRFAISKENGTINYAFLIEGIGSTFGLFGNLQEPFEYGTTLKCFIQNGQTVFPDTNYNCLLITNIAESEQLISNFSIFPNPFSNYLAISFNNNEKCCSLVIYDMYGNLVKNAKNISNGITISTEEIHAGVYTCIISDNSGVKARNKILKLK